MSQEIITAKQEDNERLDEPKFHKSIGVLSAIAINMNSMCGVGPFITIPAMLSVMGGPQAILGWIIGALIAMADGLVWAELGAAMPGAGGTYLYLREAFQYRTGKLLPFLFVWTAMLSLPLILSTGVIGFTQYLGGIVPSLSSAELHTIGVLLVAAIVLSLYRHIRSVRIITIFLWLIVIIAVAATIIASFSHWSAATAFSFPKGWLTNGHFMAGLGGGLIIALYDYIGYSTIAYMGAEVKKPEKVLPKSIIGSILCMAALYLVMQLGILGTAPWEELAKSSNIASSVITNVWGHTAAVVISLLIMIAAAASIFTGLLGGSRVPFNAARDGVFFKVFGEMHPRHHFPHIALIVMGAIVAIGSFFDLTTVINMLTGVTVIVQSFAQIVAVTVLRKRQPSLKRPYKQTFYPLPSIIALLGWGYCFIALDFTTILLSFAWVGVGCVAFILYASFNKIWPFAPKEILEEFIEKQKASFKGNDL